MFANVATAGPTLLDRVIAGWPAVAFLIVVKLLTGMLNRRTTTTAAPHRAPAPAARTPQLDSRAATPNPSTGRDLVTTDRPAPEPATGMDGNQPDDKTGDETGAAMVAARPVAQLPADLMRRIPIQPDGYRRWQAQWADLQADDVDLNTVAQHGVGRRHLIWVRTAGQAGWLDHPDPPAWRLAALGSQPTEATNTQPYNGQPSPDNPLDDTPSAGPTPGPDPEPVLAAR